MLGPASYPAVSAREALSSPAAAPCALRSPGGQLSFSSEASARVTTQLSGAAVQQEASCQNNAVARYLHIYYLPCEPPESSNVSIISLFISGQK